MSLSVRWHLLCEDRAQERFFVSLGLKVLGSRPQRIFVPPRGEGAAWGWVLGQYPERMRLHPRRYPTENVALMVGVDGDSEGWELRKRRFDDELRKSAMALRTESERVAILSPTWSIETWLAVLCKWSPVDAPIGEGRTVKREVERAMAQGHISFKKAAGAWSTKTERLPSLVDGQQEMERLRAPG